MNPTDYIAAAGRTNNMDYDVIAQRIAVGDPAGGVYGDDTIIDLIHASLGVVTESAELADMLKKHIFYGKPIDIVNIKEECGDILWYIAIICRRYNVSFEQLITLLNYRSAFPIVSLSMMQTIVTL